MLSLQLCLQIFQLLPDQVSPVVWTEVEGSQVAQKILQALIDIILGQVSYQICRCLSFTLITRHNIQYLIKEIVSLII